MKVKKIDLPPNGNSFLAKMGNSETDSHWICALQCVFCHNILLPFLWPLNLAKPLFRDSSSLRIDVIVLLLLSFYIFDEDLKNFFISFPFHLIWWFFGISMCYCSTKFNRQTHAWTKLKVVEIALKTRALVGSARMHFSLVTFCVPYYSFICAHSFVSNQTITDNIKWPRPYYMAAAIQNRKNNNNFNKHYRLHLFLALQCSARIEFVKFSPGLFFNPNNCGESNIS